MTKELRELGKKRLKHFRYKLIERLASAGTCLIWLGKPGTNESVVAYDKDGHETFRGSIANLRAAIGNGGCRES